MMNCNVIPVVTWWYSFSIWQYLLVHGVTDGLDICRDRHDRRSCKNIHICVNFSWKQCVSFQNLRKNMKFKHLFNKFTHSLQSNWNSTFSFKSTIFIEIYAVLFLAKVVLIYEILVCKIFGPKIPSRKKISKKNSSQGTELI